MVSLYYHSFASDRLSSWSCFRPFSSSFFCHSQKIFMFLHLIHQLVSKLEINCKLIGAFRSICHKLDWSVFEVIHLLCLLFLVTQSVKNEFRAEIWKTVWRFAFRFFNQNSWWSWKKRFLSSVLCFCGSDFYCSGNIQTSAIILLISTPQFWCVLTFWFLVALNVQLTTSDNGPNARSLCWQQIVVQHLH